MHNEGLSGKWKESLTLLFRFCCRLAVWDTIIRSLGNGVRAVVYNVPLPPSQVPGFALETILCFPVLQPPGVHQTLWCLPQTEAFCSHIMSDWHSVRRADGVPFREVLPTLRVCFEGVGLGEYRGPGKEGGTKLLWERIEMWSKERGEWEILVTSKPDNLLKSV